MPPRSASTRTCTAIELREGQWYVETTEGSLQAHAVVVATGPFQRPRLPASAAELPDGLTQLHSVDYRNPDLLPPGGVLVVGSGASGSQIAEELVEAGRATYLCVSRHRRVPRRYAGRDVTDWLVEMERHGSVP